MITNRDDYMKFRLGTFSKEGDEPEKKEPEQETPAEGGEEKKPEAEEKSGEAPKEGELQTNSIVDAACRVVSSLIVSVIGAIVTASTKHAGAKAAGILITATALLDAILTVISEKRYGKMNDAVNELNDMKAWLVDVKNGKATVGPGDLDAVRETLLARSAELEDVMKTNPNIGPEEIEAIKFNISAAQKAAKEAGIEVSVQTYSKMKVYSKVDTIKAALYLDELGWEKVTPNGYLVPGTDQMIKIWTDENTDDTMTEVDGADGKVIGVQQSFEDFKDFVDRLIRNGVGSYSDEDEQTGAIEIAESRDEQGYSEDEIADKAEELEKEVEELKKDVAELKGEEPKSEETKPEGETATNSEGICPECGKDPCECVKPEGELETKSDFATRLMEKLNRG